MKILSLSTVELVPYLGSGKTRLMWTQGLKKLGHEVTILQPADFEFLPFLKKATQLRIAIGIFFAGRKVLRKNHFDLIEFYGDQYWLLLFWIKFFRKHNNSVLVGHADGNELYDMDKAQMYFNPRKGLKKWIYSNTHRRFSTITLSLIDKYICGCLDDLNYVIERNIFTEKEVFCVSPGIDDLFHKIPFQKDKEKIIMYFGSWIERKGVKLIPEVITNILSQHPEYKFHVYGAWSSIDIIQSSFPDELVDRILVFDKLSSTELQNELIKAAIFFFPSYSEGFGLATVESMSCSSAVVTTRTGVASQLTNERDALLVDFDDTIGMVNSINKLIADENFRVDIAYNGYLRAKEFEWEKQIKLLEEIYTNWVNNNTEKSVN